MRSLSEPRLATDMRIGGFCGCSVEDEVYFPFDWMAVELADVQEAGIN